LEVGDSMRQCLDFDTFPDSVECLSLPISRPLVALVTHKKNKTANIRRGSPAALQRFVARRMAPLTKSSRL
jgi:hypothetical protein